MWDDNASGTALSSIPANGGIGFQTWTSSEAGGSSAGYRTLDSTEYGGGNVNSSDGLSFAMFGTGFGNNARCYRKTINPLQIGSSFRVRLGIRFRNGFKGAGFFANGLNAFLFQAAATGGGDQYQYSVDGGSNWTNLAWPYGTGASTFEVTAYRVTTNRHDFVIRQENTGNIETATRNLGDPVDELHMFVGNTGSGGDNNLYFNFLSAYNPFRLPVP